MIMFLPIRDTFRDSTYDGEFVSRFYYDSIYEHAVSTCVAHYNLHYDIDDHWFGHYSSLHNQGAYIEAMQSQFLAVTINDLIYATNVKPPGLNSYMSGQYI